MHVWLPRAGGYAEDLGRSGGRRRGFTCPLFQGQICHPLDWESRKEARSQSSLITTWNISKWLLVAVERPDPTISFLPRSGSTERTGIWGFLYRECTGVFFFFFFFSYRSKKHSVSAYCCSCKKKWRDSNVLETKWRWGHYWSSAFYSPKASCSDTWGRDLSSFQILFQIVKLSFPMMSLSKTYC